MVMTQISGIRWCEQQLKIHSVSTEEALVLLSATTMGLIINDSPEKQTSSHSVAEKVGLADGKNFNGAHF